MRPLEAVRSDDLARCEQLLIEGSKSFALASKLLPKPVRDRTTILYAFCRVSDDRVDDLDAEPSKKTIDSMRERLRLAYEGRPQRDDPVDRALAGLLQDTAMPIALPEALIDGMQWDVEGRRYRTLDDVEAYGAHVAGSVGAMMTLIMFSSLEGRPRPTADVLARACDLGVAMQLTNIARDVGEDARRGRVYLPTEWLTSDGEDLLRDPRPTEDVRQSVQRLLARASVLYRRAEQGIPLLPSQCRTAIRAACYIYSDIGRTIERANFDSVSSRAVVSGRRKLWLLARSVLVGPLRSLDRELLSEPPLAATRGLVDAGLSA